MLNCFVQAGASLESLAKGAVPFSRRYSVTELRDRWRSLLYDPDVSAEASASMVNLELGKSNGNGIREASGDGGGGKRKAQSIRKQYYAMRKKLCTEVFDSFDMALRDEMCVENHAVETDGNLNNKDVNMNMNNHLLVNSLVGYGNYSGLEEAGVGSSHSMSEAVPLWKTIEDVSAPAMPVQVSLENEGGGGSGAREMIPHGLKGKCRNGVLNSDDDPAGALLGDVESHISDSLLDLTNADELLFGDIDGKDETVVDKQCYDNVDSLLLSSPCDIQANDVSDVRQSHKLDTETKLAVPGGSSAGLEVVAKPLASSHGDLGPVPDPGNKVQLSAAAQSSHCEAGEEFMNCVLNTEDPDVPCNDIVNNIVNVSAVSAVVPHSMTLKSQPIFKEVGYPDSFIHNQRRNEPDGGLKKKDIPSNSFEAPQTVRPAIVPNINSSNSPIGVILKTENPARNSTTAVSRQGNNVIANINPSHSRLVHATTMHASDGHLKQEVNYVTSWMLRNWKTC